MCMDLALFLVSFPKLLFSCKRLKFGSVQNTCQLGETKHQTLCFLIEIAVHESHLETGQFLHVIPVSMLSFKSHKTRAADTE
jgi:hypothetical protein